MSEKFTVRDFFKRFPNDNACLHHVLEVRYGARHECRSCGQVATFHRLKNRKAYSCSRCGDNLYPCAGTIFQDSRTPLQLWFYAIFLFVTTRHGVSGKELQRQLGVTYKTAWRMGQQIRLLMDQFTVDELFSGHVEVDEAYVGGHRPGKRGRGASGKTIVMGFKQRQGPFKAEIIDNVKTATLRDAVSRNIAPGAKVSTDELASYALLPEAGYDHGLVCHSKKQFAVGEHHTNHVESFWRMFKQSIKSTHIHVSQKYMERYLSEFTFRSNYRAMENAMFDLLIGAV